MLRSDDHPCVLGGIEERFVVADQARQLFGQHHIQLFNHRLLARHDATAFDEVAVQGRVILPGRQATITAARFASQVRICPVQKGQHFMNGVAQAVDVRASKLDAALDGQQAIVSMQPVGECLDLAVAPHPGWETAENMALPCRMGQAPHVLVDVSGIRPVGFDGHDVESVLFDQTPGNCCTGAIELAGAMACLAQHHYTGVGVAVEQRSECGEFRSGKGSAN